MAKLTVYKTDRTRPGRGNNPSQKVKDLFNDKVRVAVETRGQSTFYVYLRAKETNTARSEQYYAEYEADRSGGASLSDVKRAIVSRVRDDWGHVIATSDSGMGVFEALSRGGGEPPGSTTDRTVLSQLLRTQTATVGVSSDEDAINLLDEMVSEFDSAAIHRSGASTSNTNFDMYVEPGEARRGQIEYLGDDADWDRAREQVRDEVVSQKVQTIKSEIRELSTEWGLSDREIRSEVTSKIPELKQQSRRPGRGGSGGDLPFGLEPQQLAVGVVGLVVVVAAILGGLQTLGVINLLGGGGGGGGAAAVGIQAIEVSPSGGSEYVAGGSATVNVTLNGSAGGENVTVVASASSGWKETREAPVNNGSNTTQTSITLPTDTTEVTIQATIGDNTSTPNGAETVTVVPAEPAKLTVQQQSRSVKTDETATVNVTITDEYGNQVNSVNNTTVTATVNSSAVSLIREDGNRTDETTATLSGGAASFEIDPEQPNETVRVELTGDFDGTSVTVETRQPDVSLADSRLQVRDTTDTSVENGTVVSTTRLDSGNQTNVSLGNVTTLRTGNLTVSNGTELHLKLMLNGSDGVLVTDAGSEARFTTNRSENGTLDVSNVTDATEGYVFEPTPENDTRYTINLSFDRAPGEDGTELVHRRLTVNVTTEPASLDREKSSLTVEYDGESSSLNYTVEEREISVQTGSTVNFTLELVRKDGTVIEDADKPRIVRVTGEVANVTDDLEPRPEGSETAVYSFTPTTPESPNARYQVEFKNGPTVTVDVRDPINFSASTYQNSRTESSVNLTENREDTLSLRGGETVQYEFDVTYEDGGEFRNVSISDRENANVSRVESGGTDSLVTYNVTRLENITNGSNSSVTFSISGINGDRTVTVTITGNQSNATRSVRPVTPGVRSSGVVSSSTAGSLTESSATALTTSAERSVVASPRSRVRSHVG